MINVDFIIDMFALIYQQARYVLTLDRLGFQYRQARFLFSIAQIFTIQSYF